MEKYGVNIINDISGGQIDGNMFSDTTPSRMMAMKIIAVAMVLFTPISGSFIFLLCLGVASCRFRVRNPEP